MVFGFANVVKEWNGDTARQVTKAASSSVAPGAHRFVSH